MHYCQRVPRGNRGKGKETSAPSLQQEVCTESWMLCSGEQAECLSQIKVGNAVGPVLPPGFKFSIGQDNTATLSASAHALGIAEIPREADLELAMFYISWGLPKCPPSHSRSISAASTDSWSFDLFPTQNQLPGYLLKLNLCGKLLYLGSALLSDTY